MNKLLSTIEAAPYCGVAPKTLENWRVAGLGPKFLRLHGRVAYDPEDIKEWQDRHRFGSTSEADRPRMKF